MGLVGLIFIEVVVIKMWKFFHGKYTFSREQKGLGVMVAIVTVGG